MIGLNLFVNGYTIPLNVLSYCAGYRIRVHLFIFNAVSSLLKYMQFALQSLRFTRYTKTTPTVLKTKWSVPRVFGTPQPSGNRQDTVLPRYGTESEESNLFVLCFIIALICIHACKIKYQDQQIKKIMYCYVFEEYFETSHTLKQILKKNPVHKHFFKIL